MTEVLHEALIQVVQELVVRLEGEDRLEAAGDDGVWLVCTAHGYYRPANVPYLDHDWWAPTPSEALALMAEHRRLLHGAHP